MSVITFSELLILSVLISERRRRSEGEKEVRQRCSRRPDVIPEKGPGAKELRWLLGAGKAKEKDSRWFS